MGIFTNIRDNSDRLINELIFSGDDLISGTPLNDTIVGWDGADTVNALDGNDLICGDAPDTIDSAVGGNDTIFSGDGNDTAYGDAFFLEGNAKGGNDEIYAGEGDDLIYGDGRSGSSNGFDPDFGDDLVYGSQGNDTIYGDSDILGGVRDGSFRGFDGITDQHALENVRTGGRLFLNPHVCSLGFGWCLGPAGNYR